MIFKELMDSIKEFEGDIPDDATVMVSREDSSRVAYFPHSNVLWIGIQK